MTKTFQSKALFGYSKFGHWDLPFDFAQGGESFDFAQDREPVEWLVEPFDIWNFNQTVKFQQSKSPLGLTEAGPSGLGFFTTRDAIKIHASCSGLTEATETDVKIHFAACELNPPGPESIISLCTSMVGTYLEERARPAFIKEQGV